MSLESIKERLKEIDEIMQPLLRDQDVLTAKLFEEKCKEMFNTGALTEKPWFIEAPMTGFSLRSNANRHKKLAGLFESDYHCSTKFEDFEVQFSDGDIYLNFDADTKAFEFIKKYELKVNIKSLEEDLENLILKKESLENFLEKIKSSQ
jgi:hypothetical protein